MADQDAIATKIDRSYIDDFVRVRDEVVRLHGWGHKPDDMWCYVTPPGHLLPPQGWKIHLSATPRSAVDVLSATALVLLQRQVAFKFAKGLSQLRSLLSVRCDRGAGGKFITIYPTQADDFSALLEELHCATKGMEGPAILSDRAYKPGSLVHYRYGGFSGSQQVLDTEGAYVPMLVSPAGHWEQDKREAWYAPPAWAPTLVEDPVPVRKDSERGKSKVKLDDRFVVHEAIRHSNRGGVYKAIDDTTGKKIIVKQARPFVAMELDGTDARDYLRNEYETLRILEPLHVAVRPISLFEYQGHTFLAEEEVPGTTLRAWVEEQLKPEPERIMPFTRVLSIARKLANLMAAVHDKGLVFRDFTPNNVMVTPDDQLVLIDTEFMAKPGQVVTRVMTLSYVAPEELTGPPQYRAPGPEADLYSLGACLFYLCSGAHALIPTDEPEDNTTPRPSTADDRIVRPHNERVEFLVRSVAATNPTLQSFASIIVGLMAEDPDKRLRLHRAIEMLDASTVVPPTESRQTRQLSTEDVQLLLDDGRAHLAAAMTPEDETNLWPTLPLEGRLFDSCSLQAGSAGQIEVIRRAVQVTGNDQLREVLDTALRWMDRRLTHDPRVLPGLYFGRSGTYWAMYDAAADLKDDEVMQRTVRRAKNLPVKWGNPDVTHGVAGGGLAQLHLWRRTADEELRERVLICVDAILDVREPSGMIWPVRSSQPHQSDDLTHYGFAHGVAGICAFLLTVARELDRPDLLDMAVEGGDMLVSLAVPIGAGAKWPVAQKHAEGSKRFDRVCWWCSGAPGVGTFLIRLWRETGDQRYLDAAHQAAVATRAERWLLSASHCHGLAGNGEFLLDMAAATGDRQYRDWAEEHALALYRLCSLREGRLVPLDESSVAVTYSYNVGMSGPLGFLHRLLHGGERWWMVDDFTLEAEIDC